MKTINALTIIILLFIASVCFVMADNSEESPNEKGTSIQNNQDSVAVQFVNQ